MNPLAEVIKAKEIDTWLHKEKSFYLKIFLLFFTVFGAFYPNRIDVMIFDSILLASLFISGKLYDLFISLIFLYSMTILPIELISFLSGTNVSYLIFLAIYTLSTVLSFFLFTSTTKNETIEEKIKIKVLIYSFNFIYYAIYELQEIINSFKVRGYRVSYLKPWKAVPILVSYVYLLSQRLDMIEISVEARGGD
ncbi:hypothetical protein [Fervidicoccus sp.]|uniref:hypothetical protein n=1 Tax=Fervidicoccus sp. TaxID=2060324 RepID=UPI003D0E6CC3